MGSGGLQDGPRGLGDIRTWPDKPEEWRKMLQESSKRHTEKAETAKIIRLVWVFEGFWLLQVFGGTCLEEGFGEVRDPKTGPNEPKTAPTSTEDCPGELLERSQTALGRRL